MKRDGYLIEEIVQDGNMNAAFDEVVSGRVRKRSRDGRYLIAHREEVLSKLKEEIADGSFEPGPYKEREIKEAGKVRKIQVLPQEKRIGINAVMRVMDEHMRRRFIRTTSASIKGRGMHDLLQYIRDDLRKDPEGTKYAYKFDLKKCYESIRQDLVMWCVERTFKDPTLLTLVGKFVHMMPSGLSLGLRSSQGLANLLLSVFLDHCLKDRWGIKHYYRYCDDGLVLAGSKEELWRIRQLVHAQVDEMGMEVKGNERVYPVTEGIDFLGYVIRSGEDVRLRKRIKKTFAKRLQRVKSRKRRRVLVASFYGMAKHANCNNLFKTLTGIDIMKSFKELNVTYQPEDGMKRFPGSIISIRELVNLPIVVKDFEMGIKTEQGEDRCIVAIEVNGEARKFFTNSQEMKNILTQIASMADGLPFETTIRSEVFGKGRTKYIFS